MQSISPLRFSRPLTAQADGRGASIRPGGSLTSGTPAASYREGVFDFRMPILVLGLEPVVDAAAFPGRLEMMMAKDIGAPNATGVALRAAGIVVGAPFVQHIPFDEAVATGILLSAANFFVQSAEYGRAESAALAAGADSFAAADAGAAALGGPAALALIIGVPIAAITGGALGWSAAELTGRNQIVARWITVAGTVEAHRLEWDAATVAPGVLSTERFGRALAQAVASVVRFRHPLRPNELVQADESSILARLAAPDACTGGRRYDKVYAAACLRLAPSALAPLPFDPHAGDATRAPQAPAPSVRAPSVAVPDPEPPTAWDGPGPRPTIPPENLQPHAEGLASRARRYAVPAVLVVTAVATAGLLWSLVRTAGARQGEASEAVRANPGRESTETTTVVWGPSPTNRLALRRLVQERAPARYLVLVHPSSAEARAMRRLGFEGVTGTAGREKAFSVDAGRLPGVVEALLETGSDRDRSLAIGILQGLRIRLA